MLSTVLNGGLSSVESDWHGPEKPDSSVAGLFSAVLMCWMAPDDFVAGD